MIIHTIIYQKQLVNSNSNSSSKNEDIKRLCVAYRYLTSNTERIAIKVISWDYYSEAFNANPKTLFREDEFDSSFWFPKVKKLDIDVEIIKITKARGCVIPESYLDFFNKVNDKLRTLVYSDYGMPPRSIRLFGGKSTRIKLLDIKSNIVMDGQLGYNTYLGYGNYLYKNFPTYRESIDKCNSIFKEFLGFSVLEKSDNLTDLYQLSEKPLILFPTIFMVQYSLYNLYLDWNVVQSNILGISFGEICGMLAKGFLSLETACKIIAFRAITMDKIQDTGKLIHIHVGANEFNQNYSSRFPHIEIACYLMDNQILVGASDDKYLSEIEQELSNRNIKFHYIFINNSYHTSKQEIYKEELMKLFGSIQGEMENDSRLRNSKIPYFSSQKGGVLVLKGKVFIDNNKNTLYDDGEPGYSGGITIIPLDNAVNYLGEPLKPQVVKPNGEFVWDGLMERVLYRFNYSNPQGYYFEDYNKDLECPDGKVCIRDALPQEGYKGKVVIENTNSFEVPLIPNPSAVKGTSILCLKIIIDMGAQQAPQTTDTTGSYSTASSSTQYAGNNIVVGASGVAFLDTNENSIQDPDELTNGVPGVLVSVQSPSGQISQVVASKLGGVWSVGGLKSNTYYSFIFSNPKDYKFGDLNENHVCKDCLHPPTDAEKPIDALYVQTLESYKIPLIYSPGTPAGSQNVSIPTFITVFGSLTGTVSSTIGGTAPTKPPQSVPQFGVAFHGFFFNDLNNDGFPNGGNEGGVAGASIQISEDGDPVPSGFSRNPIKPNPYTTTSNGQFVFDDMVPGRSYQFKIFNPAGFAFGKISPNYECKDCIRRTMPSDKVFAKYIFTLPFAAIPLVEFKGIDEGEQSIDIILDIPPNIEPPVFTPPPTHPPTQTPSPTPSPNQSQSPNPTFTGTGLIGFMYTDFSGNGFKDSNETWYSGLEVVLLDINKNPVRDASGHLIPPSTTDENGRFLFENVKPGKYYLKITGGLRNVYDPGFIGPFTVDPSNSTPSTSNDGVASPTVSNIGFYGLFPKGGSTCFGTVYYDNNLNDNYDSGNDRPMGGIPVKCYCPVYSYLIASTVTDQNGYWTFNGLWPNMNYRIDFELSGQLISTGHSPSRVVFGGEGRIDFGVYNAQNNLQQENANNPTSFITTCFVRGASNGKYSNYAAVINVAANATGFAYKNGGDRFVTKMANHGQVGSVNGVAYRPETGDTFVSAYYKGHTGFGPGGIAQIYKIDRNNQVSQFVNLNSIFGDKYAGVDYHVFNKVADEDARTSYNAGKNSLGDMFLTRKYLFVSNLWRKNILFIPLNETPNKDNIIQLQIDNIECKDPNGWNPFGITLYQDELYAGGVCSTQNTDRTAIVQRYNRAQSKWELIFKFALTYSRGCKTKVECVGTHWYPWSNSMVSQAMMSGIMFDDSGRLLISLRDRHGDIREKVPGPDLLVACPTESGYFQLENRGICGGVTGANPGSFRSMEGKPYGPGGGQFFNVKSPWHDYGAAFAFARAGPQSIITTGFDFQDTGEGNFRWYNTTNGKLTRGFSIFSTKANAQVFGKVNGLGAVTPVYPVSMNVYEIGRVWFDCNGNGIQDCNEPGIPGVKVWLFYKDNPHCPVASTCTDKNGYFKFEILPGREYSCVILPNEISDKYGDFILSPVLTDPNLQYVNSDAAFINGKLISSYRSSVFSGYTFSHCHFGIVKPNGNTPKGYSKLLGFNPYPISILSNQEENFLKYSNYTYSIFDQTY
eukprot:gene6751-8371_t